MWMPAVHRDRRSVEHERGGRRTVNLSVDQLSHREHSDRVSRVQLRKAAGGVAGERSFMVDILSKLAAERKRPGRSWRRRHPEVIGEDHRRKLDPHVGGPAVEELGQYERLWA